MHTYPVFPVPRARCIASTLSRSVLFSSSSEDALVSRARNERYMSFSVFFSSLSLNTEQNRNKTGRTRCNQGCKRLGLQSVALRELAFQRREPTSVGARNRSRTRHAWASEFRKWPTWARHSRLRLAWFPGDERRLDVFLTRGST